MVKEGHAVGLLSGELPIEQRASIIKRFRDGKEKVLITTNVSARGMIIHLPTILKNSMFILYFQNWYQLHPSPNPWPAQYPLCCQSIGGWLCPVNFLDLYILSHLGIPEHHSHSVGRKPLLHVIWAWVIFLHNSTIFWLSGSSTSKKTWYLMCYLWDLALATH